MPAVYSKSSLFWNSQLYSGLRFTGARRLHMMLSILNQPRDGHRSVAAAPAPAQHAQQGTLVLSQTAMPTKPGFYK
jgi:hypothetical protein